MHRVAWDLRAEPFGAATSGLAGAFVLTNLGPFVVPGDYRVQVTIDGKAETRTAKVLPDPLVEITDADRQTLYKALVTLTDMQRTASSAADSVVKLDEQMTSIGTALKSHADVPPAVATAVSNLSKRVTELRTSIAGRPGQGGGGGGGGGGPQPVRNRINSLKQEVIGSQSLPTRLQLTQVEVVQKQLTTLVSQLNEVIAAGLPALYKQLSDSNIHPGLVAMPPIKP